MDLSHQLNEKAINSLLWIGQTGGVTGYGTAPSYTGSERLRQLGLVYSAPGHSGHYHLTQQGRIAFEFYQAARRQHQTHHSRTR
jgi:hypothetical protein